MKSAILICLFVAFGYIMNAQLSLQPQIGFENTRTSIDLNDISTFSPGGAKLSPQAGLRLDYKFKQMHGPFLGVSTSRSIVKLNFSDPASVMNTYKTASGKTQFRLEAGYQLSTKPLYFNKPASAAKSSKGHCQKSMERKSCGNSEARKSCGSKASKPAVAAKPSNNVSWVRIQPSLGLAYIPFSPTAEIVEKNQGAQTSYEYNAGNWKTALTSGVGFEFGKNANQSFIISLNYLKSVGNNNSKSITTASGNKLTNLNLNSNASIWTLRMGIPISFNKKAPVVKRQIIEKTYREEKKCGQYKMYYKSRCNKVI